MKLSELAKELKCATSTLTRLVKTGAIHANPDGSVDRDRALLEITRNTSGSGGGWDGRPGRVSLYDRAKALLNKGNASSRRTASPKESSCSGARDILGLSEADLATILGDPIDDTPAVPTAREVFDTMLSRRHLVPGILAELGVQDAALIHCADDLFLSFVLNLGGYIAYSPDLDDLPLVETDIGTIAKKYKTKFTRSTIARADKMADSACAAIERALVESANHKPTTKEKETCRGRKKNTMLN